MGYTIFWPAMFLDRLIGAFIVNFLPRGTEEERLAARPSSTETGFRMEHLIHK
jgi:hypothetical protein